MNRKIDNGSILVVDDTPENLRLLTRILTNKGYKVRPAPTGTHALTTAAKETPDLVLLDIMMPDASGYEICRQLKAEQKTRDVPVIFLSALNETQDKIEGFAAGGVDYITKPFFEQEVLARVETHLRSHRLQQQLQDEALRFKSLAEAAFEGILIHTDNRVLDLNPAAATLFGRSEPDLVGTSLTQLFPPEIQEQINSGAPLPFEGEIFRPDQSLVPVEIRTGTLSTKDPQTQITAIRDLSLHKKMEQEKNQLLQENLKLKENLGTRFKFGELIGRSVRMQQVYELISKAAASAYPVIITGESGTGKELVAKTIHQAAFSGPEPFVTVNCGAVTESLFEREFFGHRKGAFTDAIRDQPGYLDAAHGGTLFLDEIGDLPLTMQVKLLRVLESGEYTPVGATTVKKATVRVITATNKDMNSLVQQGKFREDLYYRIHVIEIHLPPLRERREDIRLLVEHILARNNASEQIATLPDALREMFSRYDWPGNVRELLNTIQRFLATGSVSLSGGRKVNLVSPKQQQGLNSAVEALEKQMIAEGLEETGWQRGKTAELLGIPRRSLLRKMNKYQISK